MKIATVLLFVNVLILIEGSWGIRVGRIPSLIKFYTPHILVLGIPEFEVLREPIHN